MTTMPSRSARTRILALALALCGLMLASGCMYPNELRKQNTVNPSEFIPVVQNAVEAYHAKTGVLPIKNSEETTPLYEKYPIDFKKLQEWGLQSSLPLNAFEAGGSFMYVLVNVETKPEVKLLDLASLQSAGEVQRWVDDYKKKYGNIPTGGHVAPLISYVDFAKLGKKQPEIKSVYNRQSFVQYIVDDAGTVAIDYGPDIWSAVNRLGGPEQLKSGEDLRELLVQSSLFVPARSFGYTWQNNQPVPYIN